MNTSECGEGIVHVPDCTICMDTLRRDLVATPCGHVFHYPCIRTWTHTKPQCPLCKAHIHAYTHLRLAIPAHLIDTSCTAGAESIKEKLDGELASARHRLIMLEDKREREVQAAAKIEEQLQMATEEKKILVEDVCKVRIELFALDSQMRKLEAEMDAKLTLEKQWSRRISERLDMFRKFKNSNEFEKWIEFADGASQNDLEIISLMLKKVREEKKKLLSQSVIESQRKSNAIQKSKPRKSYVSELLESSYQEPKTVVKKPRMFTSVSRQASVSQHIGHLNPSGEGVQDLLNSLQLGENQSVLSRASQQPWMLEDPKAPKPGKTFTQTKIGKFMRI